MNTRKHHKRDQKVLEFTQNCYVCVLKGIFLFCRLSDFVNSASARLYNLISKEEINEGCDLYAIEISFITSGEHLSIDALET